MALSEQEVRQKIEQLKQVYEKYKQELEALEFEVDQILKQLEEK